MPVMTGGQAVVRSLIDNGVDTVFGIPGVQLDPLYDAFYEHRNSVKVLHTRHEQGAAFMAMGYAQATGRTGVFAVVPGPGLLNAMTAVITANSANQPVLGITGQIPSNQIGMNYGIAHEVKDQLAMSRGVVDWAERADHPSQVPGLLDAAFNHCHSGRNKAALFEMAPDQYYANAEVEPLAPAKQSPAPNPDPDLLADAAKRLHGAKRPIILVGGGVVGAAAELKSVAEALGAPVVMSPNGRGALSDEHPLAFNQLAGQQLWAEADVALVVGRRFTTPGMAWGRAGEIEVVRIDIDPTQIVKPRKAEVALLTSAAIGLGRLGEAVAGLGPRSTDLWDGCAKVRDEVAAELDAMEPLSGYNRAVRAALPHDGMLFADVTRFTVFSRFGMPFYQPRSFFMPGFQATLGWSYPAALGAKVGSPDRKVVAITGDGGFGFTLQEMSTAVLHNIPVTVVVFDNQAYGNVKTIQANKFGGRHIAVDLASPDWIKLAEAFGMKGERAESEAQLEEVLSRHLALDAPSLITVPVGEMPNVWSLVRRPPSAGGS